MQLEKTLSIIKPEAVQKGLVQLINQRFEEAGLRIIAQKTLTLTKVQAEAFYAIHKDRPFFVQLVNYMTSGPVVVQVLEAIDAVAKNREIMGSTNPADALPGTIRRDFGESIEANAVHGSDSIYNAAREIAFFFESLE